MLGLGQRTVNQIQTNTVGRHRRSDGPAALYRELIRHRSALPPPLPKRNQPGDVLVSCSRGDAGIIYRQQSAAHGFPACLTTIGGLPVSAIFLSSPIMSSPVSDPIPVSSKPRSATSTDQSSTAKYVLYVPSVSKCLTEPSFNSKSCPRCFGRVEGPRQHHTILR